MSDTSKPHSYDQVPYPSLCYSQTHPDRLATIAKLLGMNPAPIDHCRVLEIGCAGGGNLIPMAYTLPQSTFVGMDYAPVQIEEANAAKDALGLSNIRFDTLDILDISADYGQFDYIIAHGIYSWVPAPIRDKVLQVCKQNLAPQGIAYISYNTYPGWHSFGMAREMMLYHIRELDDPNERAEQARELIYFLADSTPEDAWNGYGAFLHSYTELLDKQMEHAGQRKDSALLHDELEETNQPVYFYQFMEHATQHGLQYLAEADFPLVMPNNFPRPVFERLLRTAKNPIEMEQYMDFLRNRPFRQTLLCHQEASLSRNLDPTHLGELYAVSIAQALVPDPEQPEIQKIISGNNLTFATDHPITKTALLYLIEVSPQAVSFSDLLAIARQRLQLERISAEDAGILAVNLLQAFTFSLRLIELHTIAAPFVQKAGEFPQASRLARLQSQTHPKVTNLRHERVELDKFSHYIFRFLDGEHSQEDIINLLMEQVEAGNLHFKQQEQALNTPESIRAVLGQQLNSTLNWLAQAALLEA